MQGVWPRSFILSSGCAYSACTECFASGLHYPSDHARWLLGDLVAIIYVAAVAIHLDPLAWAVGIYDVGGAFFFFLGFWLFLRERLGASALAYLLGCLFKESVIILPIILISHMVFMTPAGQIKAQLVRQWSYAVPFAIIMVIFTIFKLMGTSPLRFPDNHPYVIDLFGSHIANNMLLYIWWMSQSIIPYLTRLRLGDTLILAVAVALPVFVFVFVSITRAQSKHARNAGFLVV